MIRKGHLRSLLLATAVSLAPASSRAQADTTFELVDLGTLGGNAAIATGVNGFGEIIGWSDLAAGGSRHAFVWTPWSGMIDLGTLGGSRSHPVALTPFGRVVGWSTLPGDATRRAFSWTWWEGMIDLGTLGGTSSEPAPARSEDSAESPGVNAFGQVVGWSALAGNRAYHAFSWTPHGGMVDLGTLGGTNSDALAVNHLGQVIGSSYIAGDAASHAFSWTRGEGMVDLGTLGGSLSLAVALNDHGQVVGWSTLPGDVYWHAFSWTRAGGMIDLGTLGGPSSRAMFVSELGQVFGESLDTRHELPHAFVWTRAGGISDMFPTAARNVRLVAVNAIGQVAGRTEWPFEETYFWSRETGGLYLPQRAGYPTAINIFGQVVGCYPYYYEPTAPAFSWTKRGGFATLPWLAEGGWYACAFAVGPTGIVVGQSGPGHAVAWFPHR